MYINSIKKKYPYKEAEATVIKIIRCFSKEGFVIDYDKDDAVFDLRSTEEKYGFFSEKRDDFSRYEIYDKVREHVVGKFAIIDEDFEGNPVAKVYEHWHEQELLVEYEDLYGNKHQGKIDISSKTEYKLGDQLEICYLIDNPDEVNINGCGNKTIEDYMEKLFFTILIVSIILFFALIMVVYCIKRSN